MRLLFSTHSHSTESHLTHSNPNCSSNIIHSSALPTSPIQPTLPLSPISPTVSNSPYCNPSFLSGSLLNIRSLTKPLKYNFVYDLLISDNPSFFALTETWLNNSNYSISALAIPPNFSFLHNPRNSGRGGGVALICSDRFFP